MCVWLSGRRKVYVPALTPAASAAFRWRFLDASRPRYFLMAGREEPERSLRPAMAPFASSRYAIVCTGKDRRDRAVSR